MEVKTYLECFSNFLLGIRVLHLSCHHCEELCLVSNPISYTQGSPCHTWEINGAIVISINLVDHILQLGLGRVLPKRPHDGA